MILAIPGSFDAVESVVLKGGKTQRNPTLIAGEIWESGHKCQWIVLDRAGGPTSASKMSIGMGMSTTAIRTSIALSIARNNLTSIWDFMRRRYRRGACPFILKWSPTKRLGNLKENELRRIEKRAL